MLHVTTIHVETYMLRHGIEVPLGSAEAVTDHSLRSDGPGAFTRDRLTLLAYGMAIAFGFAVSVMGPAMPSMREDLGISRTVGGLHFTALAAGSVISGFLVDRFITLWGRRTVFWLGGAGVATGTLLMAIGWHPIITLSGALLIGLSGVSMVTVGQATLFDHHPHHRPVVLTEVNSAMSIGSVIPGILIGISLAIGTGWRTPLVLPLLILVLHRLIYRFEVFPPGPVLETRTTRRDLPRAYWLFWAGFIPSVGAEWSLGAWGAGYLVDVVGTTEGSASLLMTSFFGAMVAGRLLGGRVARTVKPFPLLVGASMVGLGGFLLFWGSQSAVPVVCGLLISGLGISMQIPMLMSLAIDTAPSRADAATARISISSGSSVLVAPLVARCHRRSGGDPGRLRHRARAVLPRRIARLAWPSGRRHR